MLTLKNINICLFVAFLFLMVIYPVASKSNCDIEVIAWVPPYSISACQSAVQANFGACSTKDGLTRIALQFWVPNLNGSIKYADHEWYTPTDNDVYWWKNWGNTHNIPILLCIYNNTGTWDWNLAVSAFATNRTTFVNALVTELDRLGLDGIDVDLEGLGSLDNDRAAFNQFIQELSVELKARGKLLTIDTFAYIWNAPNVTWWSDWVGVVDNIHSMGYEELFEGATTVYGPYSYQQNTGIAAGYAPQVVSMGVPSFLASWGTSSGRGTSAQAHIQEIRYDIAAPTGIAIWDLELAQWKNSNLWCEIAGLKSTNCCPPAGTPCNDNDPSTQNDVEDGSCNCAGMPCVPSATAVDGCTETPGAVQLSLTNTTGTSYTWYDLPTGGTALGTGTSFTTPSINTTTIYYVGEQSSFNTIAGPPTTNNGFTGINDWNTVNQQSFDVLQDFTLKAMTIRPLIWSSTHTVAFEIRDSNGTIIPNGIQSFAITGTSGGPFWHDIMFANGGIDFVFGSYTLTITSSVAIGHWSNVGYPVADNYISFTNSDVFDEIMALHDWQIESTTSGTCGRIPVVAQVGNCNNGMALEAIVLLEGPYDQTTGMLNTDLKNTNLIPLTEPYTAMGWHNGIRQTTATVLANYPVVDWVLVELRDKADPTQVVAAQAALLLENGKLVGENGIDLLYWSVLPDDYYVVMRHRNHLDVMTAIPVPLFGVTTVDFTTLPLYGGQIASTTVNGVQLLWSGDATADNIVSSSDRSAAWNDRNQVGYLTADCDLSSNVNAIDRSVIWNRRNLIAQVPTN